MGVIDYQMGNRAPIPGLRKFGVKDARVGCILLIFFNHFCKQSVRFSQLIKDFFLPFPDVVEIH